MQPKLIITTLAGKSKKCKVEILNRILIKDENAIADEVIPNVFLVYTTLSPLEAFGLIISAPPSCIAKIFTIDSIVSDMSNIYSVAKDLLLSKKTEKFYVECINRNSRDIDCRTLEIGIGLSVKDFIKVDYKNPDHILFINLINNQAYLSLMKKGQEKVSGKPPS